MKITHLIQQRDAALERGDVGEADRITRKLQDMARTGSPPARRAARRIIQHDRRAA